MSSKLSRTAEIVARRRRLSTAIGDSLRELGLELSLLNRRIGVRMELSDVDLGCLDLISLHGPLRPSALAQVADLHPATVTGVLDRLERGGWILRDRAPADRRGVLVAVVSERNAEMARHYAGMGKSMRDIAARYKEDELEIIADFLRRTIEAGASAIDELGKP
jgi:DNA-binding MarR family transcriptional regulator